LAKRYVIRDGKIYARVSYFDSTGKERQLWRRAESRTEAKNLADDLAHSLRQFGTETFDHQLTVGEYLDKWLKSLKLTERTCRCCETVLRLYVRPMFGKRKIASIRPLDVQELIDSLSERGLSSNTIRRTHVVLSRSLKQAVRWRLITFNPAHDIQLPKRHKPEMKTLTLQEAQRFLVSAGKDKYSLVFKVALWTGMRPEEYLGLQWKDVDFGEGTITVQRAMLFNRKGGGWYFKEPKTAQSRRTIPIPAHLVAQLKRHRAKQLAERLESGDKYQNNDLVFATSSGSPISIRNLDRRHFKSLLQKAKPRHTLVRPPPFLARLSSSPPGRTPK
jgi:integrase